jgi:hypothetical protein
MASWMLRRFGATLREHQYSKMNWRRRRASSLNSNGWTNCGMVDLPDPTPAQRRPSTRVSECGTSCQAIPTCRAADPPSHSRTSSATTVTTRILRHLIAKRRHAWTPGTSRQGCGVASEVPLSSVLASGCGQLREKRRPRSVRPDGRAVGCAFERGGRCRAAVQVAVGRVRRAWSGCSGYRASVCSWGVDTDVRSG